jgi:2,3-bisphosphoglycerate-dependent phosphoglycerate mutase
MADSLSFLGMELWLIRHGETAYNLERRHQGQLDVPLSSVGIQQAHKLSARLAKTKFAAVYSSDLSRALKTAEIAFAGRVQTDVRWREIDVGERSGKLYAEVAQKLRSVQEQHPNGESRAEVMERVLAAIQAMFQKHAASRVVVFTHGGAIRAALHGVLGDFEQQLDFAERGNTSISKLEVKADLRGCLLVYNDTAHLE